MFHVEGLAVQAMASQAKPRVFCAPRMFHVEHLCRLPRVFGAVCEEFRNTKFFAKKAVPEVPKNCTISVNEGVGWGGILPLFPELKLGLHAAGPSFGNASIVRQRKEILGSCGGELRD